jgi:RNA polymerase sigma-70 factor (ECF subfamily)
VLRRGKDRAEAARIVRYDIDRLAVEAARRDPSRFESLYRKYVAQIYTFAYYELRERQAAEDLTADVFMRALAALPRFREQASVDGSSFRAWLFQIARNALRNERRRLSRHPQAPLEAAVARPAPFDVPQQVSVRDELAEALRAIDALPAQRRQALLLRFVHEMSAREIGEVMGKSEVAVRVTIHRALRAVAEQLGRTPPGRPD